MIKICQQCNQKFDAKNKNVKYCCKKCYSQSMVTTSTKMCPICNKEFKQTYAKQKFCSKECAGKALRNDEIKLICRCCNKEFIKKKNGSDIYCSKECYNKENNLPVLIIICKCCNKKFKTKRKNSIYCSQKCHYKDVNKISSKIKICKKCGKEYTSSHNEKYCSRKCYYLDIKKEDIKFKCKYCKKEIISKYKKRIFCSKECRSAWSKTEEGRKTAGMKMFGKISPKRGTVLSDEVKKKISESTKKSMRLAMDSKGKNWQPFFNKTAAEYFLKYDEENHTNGQHALNGGERRIYNKGNIFIDYINDDLKLIIEYDEPHHKYKQDYDTDRENRIRELLPEYKIIRIDDCLIKTYEDFIKMVNL